MKKPDTLVDKVFEAINTADQFGKAITIFQTNTPDVTVIKFFSVVAGAITEHGRVFQFIRLNNAMLLVTVLPDDWYIEGKDKIASLVWF